MPGYIAHDQVQKFVALRENHAEVTAYGTRGAVVGLNGKVAPNQVSRGE